MALSNAEVHAQRRLGEHEAGTDPARAERAYRHALGRFPTGVAIITTLAADGRNHGVTVNSFTSVSLRPRLVSFNLATSLQSISIWLQADAFAVNLLKDSQERLSAGFARPNSDKWSNVEFLAGVTASPILTPNLAHFECEKFACHEAGDHYIMIGRVVDFVADGDDHPLVFYRGNYCRLVKPSGHEGAP